jgi:hypothetical protein
MKHLILILSAFLITSYSFGQSSNQTESESIISVNDTTAITATEADLPAQKEEKEKLKDGAIFIIIAGAGTGAYLTCRMLVRAAFRSLNNSLNNAFDGEQ